MTKLRNPTLKPIQHCWRHTEKVELIAHICDIGLCRDFADAILAILTILWILKALSSTLSTLFVHYEASVNSSVSSATLNLEGKLQNQSGRYWSGGITGKR